MLTTYLVMAFIISAVTTIVMLGYAIHYFQYYDSGPDARRTKARSVLACTLGYVLAFTWPVSIPLIFLVGFVYFLLQASPSNTKE